MAVKEIRRNTLGNPLVRYSFERWLSSMLLPGVLDGVDVKQEFDDQLTFQEAKQQALKLYPGGFILQQPERAREIIFLPWIISKILTGQVECTYRKTIKTGIYYTIPTRFARNGDPKREPRCLLEFYRNETVDPNQLTDREAQLAGCDDAAHIKNLFKQWYGEPLPTMWRNWFRLIQ